MGGIGGVGVKPDTQTIFDQAGYDKAVAAAKAKADALSGAAAGRESLYSTIGSDTTNNAMVDLNKERAITERDLGFILARAGLSGGSRDVDVNRDILDNYQLGTLNASDMGLAAVNNARSADDKTRVNLINNIRAGLDQGSAIQQAYEGMRNNAQMAQDDAKATSMKGFFDVLNQQQQNAAYTAGYNNTVNPYLLNQRVTPATSSATKSYGGTIRSS